MRCGACRLIVDVLYIAQPPVGRLIVGFGGPPMGVGRKQRGTDRIALSRLEAVLQAIDGSDGLVAGGGDGAGLDKVS